MALRSFLCEVSICRFVTSNCSIARIFSALQSFSLDTGKGRLNESRPFTSVHLSLYLFSIFSSQTFPFGTRVFFAIIDQFDCATNRLIFKLIQFFKLFRTVSITGCKCKRLFIKFSLYLPNFAASNEDFTAAG